MGAADIIPGVSGGTVALILGIYTRLVTAISRCDRRFLTLLSQRQWQAAAEHIDLRFLVALAAGIGCGVVALGSIMHTLLEDYQQQTLAVFFGLIVGSCLLVGRLVGRWRGLEFVLLALGAAGALWLVRQPVLSSPPDSLWYIFACGVVAICAMILPGISGAFILLILGRYHEITGYIKSALHLELTLQAILTIAVFGIGCVTGLLAFSKCLRWLLSRHSSETMAALCGLMAGSLWKIWPFQRDVSPPGVTEFKERVFEPVAFSEVPMNGATLLTLLLAIGAFLFVVVLDRVAVAGKAAPSKEPATDPA